MRELTRIDLQDFNDCRIDDGGEIEVTPYFQLPIILELGRSSLELTRMEFPIDVINTNPLDNKQSTHTNVYVIRNMDRPESSDSLAFGEKDFITDNDFGYGNITTRTYGGLILGRETTPDLKLDKTVSREHLQIRIGNMAQNIHFTDIDSTNGSVIKVERRMVSDPRKEFVFDPEIGRSKPLVVAEQRWRR